MAANLSAHMSIHSASIANKLVDVHTSIVNLTHSIKEFKAGPIPALSDSFRDRLNEIKENWNQFKTATNPISDGDFKAVDLSISLTETKVAKLLKKYPPQTLTPAQPSQSLEAQQISQRANQTGIIAFYDDQTDALTSCFGNFHPCNIEFEQKYYKNAEAIFQAQKFTDQPLVMALFENVDGAEAVRLARSNNMTPKRVKEWDSQEPNVNRVDVMRNVQRAKYGQNPHLKEKLMATNSAYIVEHLPDQNRRDKFWSDGFDGTGENKLGICLMELRGEYDGTGIVHKSRFTVKFYENCQASSSVANFQDQLAQQAAQYHQLLLQSKCIQCKTNLKFIETTGKVHDYCGRTCAKAAGALNQ